MSLNGLAGVLRDSKRTSEAEPLYKRALAIRELGNGSPELAETLRDYAILLQATNRSALGMQFEARALALGGRSQLRGDVPSQCGVALTPKRSSESVCVVQSRRSAKQQRVWQRAPSILRR